LAEFTRTGVPRSMEDILRDIETINEHIAIAQKKTREAIEDDVGAKYGIGYGNKKVSRTGKQGNWWLGREQETK